MTPKSLLRHKRAVSRLDDFGPESQFQLVLECAELPSEPQQAKQVVLCSGKVYYDLLDEREKRGITDVHILRLEQLYPFPAQPLAHLLEPYAHCRLVWAQEEPRNMGAWTFVRDLIPRVAEKLGFSNPEPRYAGREASASPATGSYERHLAEQARLVDEALNVSADVVDRIFCGKPIR